MPFELERMRVVTATQRGAARSPLTRPPIRFHASDLPALNPLTCQYLRYSAQPTGSPSNEDHLPEFTVALRADAHRVRQFLDPRPNRTYSEGRHPLGVSGLATG